MAEQRPSVRFEFFVSLQLTALRTQSATCNMCTLQSYICTNGKPVFVKIQKYICSNPKKYLFKLEKKSVQIPKKTIYLLLCTSATWNMCTICQNFKIYICSNSQIYLVKVQNMKYICECAVNRSAHTICHLQYVHTTELYLYKLKNVFGNILKCICVHNLPLAICAHFTLERVVFVQNANHTCPNSKLYLSKLQNICVQAVAVVECS